MAEFPPNPFLPSETRNLIARERELKWLLGNLRKASSVALVGWPRLGKTAVLKLLMQRAMELDRHALVYVDCDAFSGDAGPEDFWRPVLRGNQTPRFAMIPELHRLERQGYEQLALHSALSRAYGELRLVLLLDHAEKLVHHPGLRSMVLHGGLRALSNDAAAPLRLVLASRLDLEGLNKATQRPTGSPLFNHLEERHLGLMADSEIRDLIACCQQGTGFLLSPEDLDLIVEQAGGHPHLALTVASVLFDLRFGPRRLSVIQAHAAARSQLPFLAMSELEALFTNLRDYQQVALVAVATNDPIAASLELDRLFDLGLLRWNSGGCQVRSALLLNWLLNGPSTSSRKKTPLHVHIVFSNKDRKYRDHLVTRLHGLISSRQIDHWDRACTKPGDHVEDQLVTRLPTAEFVLVLCSPNLWSAPECQVEMQAIFPPGPAARGRVVPILVRPDVNYDHPLYKLHALPSNSRCIYDWARPESGWRNVMEGLIKIFYNRLQ